MQIKVSKGRSQCARCGHPGNGVHELKIWPMHFSDVQNGRKLFELRRNDRGFEVGDTLILNEWDPETNQYTGKWVARHVNCIVAKCEGLKDGFVILGIQAA